jgi:hypothetical protein
MPARRKFRRLRRFARATLFIAFAISAYVAYRTWPRPLGVSISPQYPRPLIEDGRLAIQFSAEIAAADVASYDDQLEAYLRFEYLRGRDPEDAWRVLLTATTTGQVTYYKIFMVVENDLLAAVPHLTGLESLGLIPGYELTAWTNKDLARYQQQSLTFESVYNMPTQKKLETLPSFEVLPELARFLVFKSQTDWRVVNEGVQAPLPLTHEQAMRTASDILDVAHFYNLPLDYFLGVGAMENDYMNVDGDLQHTVWKKRALPGDIILQRRRKRVLVSDYSVGAWQISRETLRRAHELYLNDHRDYNQLPPHLRPPRQFDVNSVNQEVLTTYSGLLLRDLLDRFGGNVDQAIGAYNGGVRNPNPSYAARVKAIADYARKMLEHAPLPPLRSPQSILPGGTVL